MAEDSPSAVMLGKTARADTPCMLLHPPLGLDPPEDRLGWELPFTQLKPMECAHPVSFKRKLETGVKNGDCLPACFTAMLECMHRGCISSKDLEGPAAKLRADLIKWIKDKWDDYPAFNPEMKVGEIMWMQHALGVTTREASDAVEWGDSPESHLAAYASVCDRLYFSDAEMLMFSSMIWERRQLPLVFRTFRCTGRDTATGKYISTTPDPQYMTLHNVTECIVIDMAHTGTVDAFSAHYKLLSSASLEGLTQVNTASAVRRRRLVRTGESTGQDAKRHRGDGVQSPSLQLPA